jgi:hypothetical protein
MQKGVIMSELKLSKAFSDIDEGIAELFTMAQKEMSFLSRYGTIDHIPEPRIVEISTILDSTKKDSITHSQIKKYVSTVGNLIPVHVASVQAELGKSKNIFIHTPVGLTNDGITRIGLYTKIILF